MKRKFPSLDMPLQKLAPQKVPLTYKPGGLLSEFYGSFRTPACKLGFFETPPISVRERIVSQTKVFEKGFHLEIFAL